MNACSLSIKFWGMSCITKHIGYTTAVSLPLVCWYNNRTEFNTAYAFPERLMQFDMIRVIQSYWHLSPKPYFQIIYNRYNDQKHYIQNCSQWFTLLAWATLPAGCFNKHWCALLLSIHLKYAECLSPVYNLSFVSLSGFDDFPSQISIWVGNREKQMLKHYTWQTDVFVCFLTFVTSHSSSCWTKEGNCFQVLL